MSFILSIFLFLMMARSIMLKDRGEFHQIIWMGFFLRLILLVFSITDIIPVPDAHEDADAFHEISVSNQGHNVALWEIRTNYTFVLSVIYSFSDCSRWFAQYINLTFGVYILIYIRRILCVLNVDRKTRKVIIMTATFMPFLNIYSVVLMREAWVSFFIVFSLYHFICWYIKKGKDIRNIILTIGGLIMAMYMHAGAIGILAGFAFAFLTYYRKQNCMKISANTYVALFFLGIFAFIIILNAEIFASKLLNSDVEAYAEKKSSGEGGGSDYLTWLDMSSPMNMLLFSPLKMFYFLYSPIVIDWRGLNDIAAFLLDSLFYIMVTWFVLTRRVVSPQYKLLKRYLIITFLVTTFIFSFGTANTGTAIRHRAKICSVMLVMWALSPSKKSSGSTQRGAFDKNLKLQSNRNF